MVSGDCVLWTGYIDSKGYGAVWDSERRKMVRAHRVAWEAVNGPIPSGLVIDHLCRNRACVNVAHLEVVTFKENVLRGVGPSANAARQTHCIHGHPFDAANTLRGKSGRRHCRACNRERSRKARQRA